MQTNLMGTRIPLYIISLSLLLCIVTPAPALGAEVSPKTAIDAKIFYTITFTVSAGKDSLSIPIAATRGGATDTSVGFDMLRNDEEIATEGVATGILLSDSPIGDDLMYAVPAGKTGTFVLFAVYTNNDLPRDTPYSVKLYKTIPHVEGATVKLKDSTVALSFKTVPKN